MWRVIIATNGPSPGPGKPHSRERVAGIDFEQHRFQRRATWHCLQALRWEVSDHKSLSRGRLAPRTSAPNSGAHSHQQSGPEKTSGKEIWGVGRGWEWVLFVLRLPRQAGHPPTP